MIEIIPAIDIIGGKCVRLSQGNFWSSVTYGDPLEMALMFEDHGLKRRVVNYRILEQIASRTTLVIDAGGGLRDEEDVRIVFESGAAMVTGGSIAVKERDLFLGWIDRYGSDRVILGADFREGKIAVSGWEEHTDLNLITFLSGYMEEGVKMSICTDIALDGMLQGPSLLTYRRIKKELGSLYLVASGGISHVKDIEQLDQDGIDGVVVGKAIYEGRIPLKELEKYTIDNE
jgi:phosphoribosylformimino-5-aminoimidazole carboxamide ribotide isomerase